MIEGTVTPEGRAIIRLPVQGPGGHSLSAHAAVDTAFNGFLALPAESIRRLRLPRLASKETTLADGSVTMVNAFRAIVRWHGQRREVPALEVRGGGLVGMSLLRGSRLTVDVVVNGSVRIEPIA
jgi:clan AA aspartic protease